MVLPAIGTMSGDMKRYTRHAYQNQPFAYITQTMKIHGNVHVTGHFGYFHETFYGAHEIQHVKNDVHHFVVLY